MISNYVVSTRQRSLCGAEQNFQYSENFSVFWKFVHYNENYGVCRHNTYCIYYNNKFATILLMPHCPAFDEALNRSRKRQPSFGGISVARPTLDRAARIAVGCAEFGQNSPFCAISIDKLDFIL